MTADESLVERTHSALIDAGESDPATARVDEIVRAVDPLLSTGRRRAVVEAVRARMRGLGAVDALLADGTVSDVLVNGPGVVWVERDGVLAATDVVLTAAEIERVVQRIVAPLGRQADRSAPIAEARLPDGSRVHVVLPPLAVDGPVVAIRRFPPRTFPLEAYGASTVVARLRALMDERANIVVTGGTGSGKTSLLNALGACIPADQRVVTIEDAAELRLPVAHVVRLEARPANSDGMGAIGLDVLLRSALRLRPDRIVVGEVRGPEAAVLVHALTTGHAGSLSTCHANGPLAALRRLHSLAAEGTGATAGLAERLADAVDVVVHVERAGDARRRIVAIDRVEFDAGRLRTRSVLDIPP